MYILSHEDTVDGDVNEAHEKADEAHHSESHRSGRSNLHEFYICIHVSIYIYVDT